MTHVLLLGAGFSRNWGGWLASEAFEYLLGCPEILGNIHLRRALWKSQSEGGFEHALAMLPAEPHLGTAERNQAIQAFDIAVIRMFRDMNDALLQVSDLEFPTAQPNTVTGLLARFDAIFTLNQDLLLEHRYLGNVATAAGGRWTGAHLPGLQRIGDTDGRIGTTWADSLWSDSGRTQVDPRQQPLFKLHGSTNWRTAHGGSMLIVGTAKTRAIQSDRLLNSYAQAFEEYLARPAVRLMVIGYGFHDTHINESLIRAANTGMRMFVVDPLGSDLARSLNRTRKSGMITVGIPEEDLFERCLIGASRRTLGEIFGADVVEHKKLQRFFE